MTTVVHPLTFGDEANVRQTPSENPAWQDSVVLVWWDPENKIGGFHRLGHEPNTADGGRAVLWSVIASPTGTIKRTQTMKLRDQDMISGGGYGSGDTCCTVEFKNGEHIWKFDDPDHGLKGELVHVDSGPNVDCFPKKSNVTNTFASAHFDIPGTLTGYISINEKSFQVRKGLSVRDHGWGSREWGAALLSHRWIVGTAGSDFSIFAVAWHSSDDRYANFGWVVRDNIVTVAKQVEIVTYMNDDSLTNRGGQLDMELVTGETFSTTWTPVAKAYISWHQDVACVDCLCSFRACGGSKEYHGFGDFENTSNYHAGKRKPGLVIGGILEDGFVTA